MNPLARLASYLRRSLSSVSAVPMGLWRSNVGGLSSSGVTVNENSALSVSAVFAAIRAISEDVATAPINTYRRLKPRGKEQLFDHWLVNLLENPCPEMSDFDFRQCMVSCALLFGNSYAEIERNRVGQPIALWPLEPWRVQLRRYNGALSYCVMDSSKDLAPQDMLHIKGFSLTGILGEMLIRYAKDSFGLILGAEQYAARWFSNATTPSGVITSPTPMTPEAAQQLSDQFAAYHAGLKNAGKPVVLHGGREFEQFTQNDPEKSQLLQTRMFNLTEVCRWFRIPPTKIYDMGRATWSNSEQQALDYIGDTLGPWFTKMEREVKRKLTTVDQGLFVRHVPDERTLRSDSLSRVQVQSLKIRSGIATLDEIREENDHNPLPDNMGSRFFVPRDLMTIDELYEVEGETKPETPAEDEPTEPKPEGGNPSEAPSPSENPNPPAGDGPVIGAVRSLAEINQRLLADGIRRVLHTEQDKVLRQAKKGDVLTWAATFYPAHEQFIRSIIETPIRAFIDSAIAVTGDARLIENKTQLLGLVPAMAKRHVDQSLADLNDPDGLAERVTEWMDQRTNLLASQAMDEVLDGIKGFLGETNGK